MGAALAAWGLGNLVWTYDIAILGQAPPAASIADLFYVAFYPLVVAALVCLPGAPTSTLGRLRTVLDGMIAAAALVVLLWEPLLSPLLSRPQTAAAHAVSLAYMVGDVALLAVLVSLATHSTMREPGRRDPADQRADAGHDRRHGVRRRGPPGHLCEREPGHPRLDVRVRPARAGGQPAPRRPRHRRRGDRGAGGSTPRCCSSPRPCASRWPRCPGAGRCRPASRCPDCSASSSCWPARPSRSARP